MLINWACPPSHTWSPGLQGEGEGNTEDAFSLPAHPPSWTGSWKAEPGTHTHHPDLGSGEGMNHLWSLLATRRPGPLHRVAASEAQALYEFKVPGGTTGQLGMRAAASGTGWYPRSLSLSVASGNNSHAPPPPPL